MTYSPSFVLDKLVLEINVIKSGFKIQKKLKDKNKLHNMSLVVSVQACLFHLIIYVTRWWKKYLSKRILIKHTCWWQDKLIVFWTLNRQAKIYLRKSQYCLNDGMGLKDFIHISSSLSSNSSFTYTFYYWRNYWLHYWSG